MSAQLVNAAVVKQLFLQCSSLERASRSLAKTGLFFGLFFSCFSCLFSVRFGGVGSSAGHSVTILESFSSLFGDRVDLLKRVFYVGKTILFEVWEGPSSLLFRVMLLDRYFGSICCGISRICWPLGSPWGVKWVSFGDPQGPN